MRDILKPPNDRTRKEGTKMEKKELIEALKKMDTASVSDAIDKLGIPSKCFAFRRCGVSAK